MGKGRGKGKKLTVSNHEDTGSGEEEKIPAQKRRGRPTKPLKDDIGEEVEIVEVGGDGENGETSRGSKDTKPVAEENGKKRKRLSPQPAKDVAISVKEENGITSRSSTDESSKSNGFRLSGSRRKNKPRRAAEAVVECK